MWTKVLNPKVILGMMLICFFSIQSYSQCNNIPATESIINGDFEQGNTGFNTDYNIKTAPRDYSDKKEYFVSDKSENFSKEFKGIKDHTTGSGMFFMADGSLEPGVVAWEQTVNVFPNQKYYFSAWVATLYTLDPSDVAKLQFFVDNVPLGTEFSAPVQVGQWIQFFESYTTAPTQTTAKIQLKNNSVVPMGNDFALDDISFINGCDNLSSTTKPDLGPTLILCDNWGSVTLDSKLSAAPGRTFDWVKVPSNSSLGASPTLQVTAPGVYKVCVRDGTSCVTSDEVEVKEISGVSPGSISSNQDICYNTVPAPFTSVSDAMAGSGTTIIYQWQSSTDGVNFVDIANTDNATYAPTGALTSQLYYRRKAVNGTRSCDTAYSDTVTVIVYDPIVAGSIKSDTTLCAGASAVARDITPASGGSPGRIYKWEQSTSPFSSWTLVTGASSASYPTGALTESVWYRRIATDPLCGDYLTGEFKVTVNPVLQTSVSFPDPGPICQIDSKTITATSVNAGSTRTFSWYLNNNLVTDADGIDSTFTYANWQPSQKLKVEVIPSDADVNKCFSVPKAIEEKDLNIVATYIPTVSINALPAKVVCEGTQVKFEASPQSAGQYEWKVDGVSQGAASTTSEFTPATISDGMKVSVELTSNSSCASPKTATSGEITLTVYKVPLTSITPNANTEMCAGDSKEFQAAGGEAGSVYKWYKDGNLINGATITKYLATESGSYSVEIINGGICSTKSLDVPLTVEDPEVSISQAKEIKQGESLQLEAVTNGSYTISWSPDSNLVIVDPLRPMATPRNTTTYKVVVTNATGCKDSSEVIVRVTLPLRIPNAFSPNDDGLNDSWEIDGIETYPNARIQVFNRWGNIVFEKTDIRENEIWNGTRNGEKLPEATYYYVIDPNVANEPVQKGMVTIVR